MFKSMLRATAVAVATLVLFGGGLLAPAHAANMDKVKDSGELIFYYRENKGGSWSDFAINSSDHSGYRFIGNKGLDGWNQYLKKNAASIENFHASKKVGIYAGVNYGGANLIFPKYSWANLDQSAGKLRNKNVSHKFI